MDIYFALQLFHLYFNSFLVHFIVFPVNWVKVIAFCLYVEPCKNRSLEKKITIKDYVPLGGDSRLELLYRDFLLNGRITDSCKEKHL